MAFSLKDYEILDEIGRGSFGSVLRARQKSLGRTVAIKCLQPQRAQDRHDIIRFRREAQAMAALNHDNIISVLDYAFFGGNYYIVMEYVEGFSLEEAMGRKLGLVECMVVLQKVSDALRCAHAHQVVHHDIKPGNVLLGKQGQVKLADFGLASFQQEVSQRSSMVSAVGTLAYMAPEAMVNPRDADYRVDIFSFGTVLYQVLSGNLPFPGESIGEISYKVLNEKPQPLVVSREWQEIADLAMECISKERESRPSAEMVHSVIAKGLGSRAHDAQNHLVAFVSGEPQKKTSPAQPPPKPLIHGKKSSGRLISAGVVGAVCLLGIGVFSVVTRESRNRKPSLPRLVSPDGTDLLSETSMTRDPLEGQAAKKDIEMKIGAVLIQGLRPLDTLFINGKRVPVPERRGAIAFPLPPGESRLEVRSENRRIKKDTTIAPLQLITWDVGQQRRAHGRE